MSQVCFAKNSLFISLKSSSEATCCSLVIYELLVDFRSSMCSHYVEWYRILDFSCR
jgi:hypothetical protein